MDVVPAVAGVLAGGSRTGPQARPPPPGPVLQEPQEQIGRAQRESAGEQSDREGQQEEQQGGGVKGERGTVGMLRRRRWRR
ncbi:hypothetical protein [Nocardiopsis sp. Huas11]|uniref:hypothetical protein n=1 Tax=Nocardiopsis sp. Huas11 TaxID=2183912 RepID=UPI00131506BF|nr:hypothetical protein [Nocardiopsis sp. Huas11]